MDAGHEDEQAHVGHDVQAADEGTGDLDCEPGSPMQQSPDQSNYHDNYRSPEAAAEEQEMDTADLNDVESEHSDVNVDAKHEWTADNPENVNQDADASNQVTDDLVSSEGPDALEHSEMLSESDIQYGNEDNYEIGSSNDAQVESTDNNFEDNSNIDNEIVPENNEADAEDDLDINQNIENDDLVESSEGKVRFENEDNVSSESEGGIRHVETTEFRAFGDNESSQTSNEDETTFNKDGVQAFESNEGETDSNNADTSSGISRITSFIDVVSDNDKTAEENATDKSSEFKFPEVTSTSSVDNIAAISDNANEINEMDAKRNDEIENIEHVVDEIESSDIVQNFSNVKGMDRDRVLKDVKSHLNASSTDLDNYSTVSIKGSISSSDNESDNELDLTQPSDNYDGENLSQNQSIDQENTSNIDNENGDGSLNVSSSTNSEDNTESKLDFTKTDDDTEIDKVDTETEDANVDTSKQEDSQDEDKKSEASLEEISEEEDGLDDDSAAVPDHQEKVDTAQLSGMEEVSSEEEEVDEDEDDEKKKDVKDKTDLKAESGMEEVSDEEEESGDGQLSEDGMENVSSDEEEIVEEKTEDNLDKHDHVQKQTNTDDKVKQTAEIIETVEIDDTGKDDDTIVKEILENLLRKLCKADKDESKESDIKRRKNRDKRDRKVSVKYSRRPNEKDRRDSVKDRRESVKDRRESVKERRDGAKDRRESIKDRRESVKTRSRDTRDINERLKAQASYGDDVELDYDDTVHDETREKQGSDSEGEITSSSSSEGELDEEECEEGEIMEPGSKPYVKPTCRFFMRGHCTWGINCRFLHPGVNDKGNYQLIERPGFNNKPPGAPFDDKWEEEEVERTPSPEPPPPPPEPKEETAWERGLRQAKELRKKAMEKREMETNFEHKKMNLSIEDNPEFDKENNLEKSPVKSPVKKTPYYDKYEPLSDDEYYDQTPVRLQQKQMEQSWMTGGYENFQVHWSQDQYGPPPHHPGPYPPPMGRYPYPPDRSMRGHDRFPLRPSPRRLSVSPPDQRQRYMRAPPRDPREMISREKMREPHMSPPSPTKKLPAANKARADDWHDPWTRANANKAKSPKKRSRSRGRRRSRRSYSYSSSYSSSSYSGSSRSRSSSFSSVSSRSSRSSSISRSRSPAPRTGPRMRGMRRPIPAGNQPMRRPSAQARPGEPPRGPMSMQGRPERGIEKRPGVPPPSKGVKGPAPGLTRQTSKPGGQQIADVGRPRKPPPKMAAGPQPPQKPLPQSALTKDKAKPKPGIHKRKASSSSSRSRSRSRSSSSSSRSSYSSRSSRSYSRSRSRSSSSSSSGSADSDHLYRNIGARENQKGAPQGAGRGKQDMGRHPPAGGRVPQGRPGVKPTIGETSRPSSVAQAKMVKDPLKMTGQKSNIKLTLIKQSERPPPGAVQEPVSRKRPAEPVTDAPPMKRPSVPNPPKTDKPVKKPDKAVPVSPAKVAGRVVGPAKPAAGAPGAATATVKKKSTVSRREELLKQLKAVEDAIAKKKKKMG